MARDAIIPQRTRASSAISALERLLGGRPAEELVRLALTELFPGRIALVSSFGADSVALLHIAARIDRNVPVLFLDTGMHFEETIRHRDEVATALGLTNLITIAPQPADVDAHDPAGALHGTRPDDCCALRKVRPLHRALKGYDAWMTGRRRDQSALRERMPVFEADGARTKVNPLAAWSQEDVEAHIWRHELPRHPLVEDGYPSIGCAPCTARPLPQADARAGRWAGLQKTECGIHLPAA